MSSKSEYVEPWFWLFVHQIRQNKNWVLGRQKRHAFPSNSTSFKVKLRLEWSEKYSIDGGIAVIKSFLESLEKRHEDNRRNLNNTFLHSAFSTDLERINWNAGIYDAHENHVKLCRKWRTRQRKERSLRERRKRQQWRQNLIKLAWLVRLVFYDLCSSFSFASFLSWALASIFLPRWQRVWNSKPLRNGRSWRGLWSWSRLCTCLFLGYL